MNKFEWLRKKDLITIVRAQDAFWKVIAESFPKAKTGDFPPDATLEFDRACYEAVSTWIKYNVPR